MLIALHLLIAIFVGLLITAAVLGHREWRHNSKKKKQEIGTEAIANSIAITHPLIIKFYEQYSQIMIGQQDVFVGLMSCHLAEGHCLLTGLPGTGKTLAVKIFCQLLGLDMGRVQGTSDLLPVDIVGSLIYNPKTSEFDTVFGPIMHECILVDEINRMPSKTQSALLQAMAEGNIVVGQQTYNLPGGFMVIATQNPHDRVGTFPLPQAQLDRFMCQVIVQAPGLEEQSKILMQTNQNNITEKISLNLTTSGWYKADDGRFEDLKLEYNSIIVSSSITTAVAQLIQGQGLSSRAGQQLISFARALALMQDKKIVEQGDVDIAVRYVTEHRTK